MILALSKPISGRSAVPSILEAHQLHAGYGEVRVLKDVSLRVARGSITAVIGSNGAGKTTLMRTLTGLISPERGAITFEHADVTKLPAHIRVEKGLALIPEGRLVFPDFTVDETLRVGAFPPHARDDWKTRADDMYAMFPRLRERRNVRAGALSGGEQQMLAVARGLMSKPTLLLLDEPSLGLAPAMADEVFEKLRDIRKQGVTICIVEQNVYAALQMADYGYILENGEIKTEGPAAELLEMDAIREAYLGL
jgi:branched-chain amino acid transport system ATP-binding protein